MSNSKDLTYHGGSSSQTKQKIDLEKVIIKIPECDMTVMAERFKLTLIGRVLHLGSRSIKALITQLPKPRICNVEGRVRGRNLGNGCFQFDFGNEKDLHAVLNRRPCHFNQWSFPLERWEPFTRNDFPNTIPFWVQVTGVPVHFWNDGTFTEIAKALGTKLAIDAKSARIHVSVNIDMPLQFEGTVGFPNGDTGKVTFLYVGLHRYCFTCKMISHDENNCSELSEEQRLQKRLERLAQNTPGSQRQFPLMENQNRSSTGKRQRSPTLELSRKSPPCKLQTTASHGRNENYGTGEVSREKELGNFDYSRPRNQKYGNSQYYQDKSPQRNRTASYRRSLPRQAVWGRLDRAPLPSHSSGHASHGLRSQAVRQDYKTKSNYSERDRGRDTRYRDHAKPADYDRFRGPRESRYHEWRPREQQRDKNGPKEAVDDRINESRESLRASHIPVRVEQERSDSQRTVSEQIGHAQTNGEHGSGPQK